MGKPLNIGRERNFRLESCEDSVRERKRNETKRKMEKN